jgi:hypothetical protein
MQDHETNDGRRNTGELRRSLGVYAGVEPTLHLLVFLGSSSRGDAGGAADLEIGYVADPGFDVHTFQQLAGSVLDLPRVEMVDLRSAATMAFYAAREGALVFERPPFSFADFRERAINNLCDLVFVLTAAYDRLDAPSPAAVRR